ncbi:hypothetical protein PCE1_003867 [Barthelona sp. PCE]
MTSEVGALLNKIERLEAEVMAFRNAPIEQLQKTIDSLHKNLKSANDRFDMQLTAYEGLDKKNKYLEKQLREADGVWQERVSDLEARIEVLKEKEGQAVEADERFHEKEQELRSLKDFYVKKENVLAGFITEMRNEQNSITDTVVNALMPVVKGDYSKFFAPFQNAFTGFHDQIAKQKRQISNLKGTIDSLRGENTGGTLQREKMETAMNQLEQTIDKLKSDMRQQKRQSDDALSVFRKKEIEWNDVRKELLQDKTVLQDRIQSLEEELLHNGESHDETIINLRKKLEKVVKMLGETKTRSIELESENSMLKSRIAKMESNKSAGEARQLDQMRVRLKRANDRLKEETTRNLEQQRKAKETIDGLNARVVTLEEDKEELESKLRRANAVGGSVEALEEKIDELKGEVSTLTEENQDWRLKMDISNVEKQKLKQSIEELENDIDLNRKKIMELMNRAVLLQSEKDVLEDKLHNAQHTTNNADEAIREERNKWVKKWDEREVEITSTVEQLSKHMEQLVASLAKKDKQITMLKDIVKKECTERNSLLSHIDRLEQLTAR